MNDFKFDENWTFEEIVNNIEAIKSQVREIIASFSCNQLSKKIEFKNNLREEIYSLKFDVWKREKVLECIYDYFEIDKLKKIK